MKYVGGKSRMLKHLLPLIHEWTEQGYGYAEPFLGGCNVLPKIQAAHRVASETNPYVAAVWQAAQWGWVPPTTITEEQYKAIKANPDSYDLWLVGFVAVACSFASKWWGGYARSAGRNYAAEGSAGVVAKAAGLGGAAILACSYDQLPVSRRSVIYCDPPYAATLKYSTDFDTRAFWQWAEGMAAAGHKLIVSEYQAPPGWQCVYSKELVCTVGHKYSNRVEKIWTI